MINKDKRLLNLTLKLNALTTSIALLVYAYLGFFSRFMADDYCHHQLVKNKTLLDAMQHHYLTFSNRYMILIVPYLTEQFGSRGQSFLPAIMIFLWVIALFWLLTELHILFSLKENKLTIYLLSSLLTFFTILQAPARYQSIYWEASSINRLVPLALSIFLFASLLSLIRKRKSEKYLFRWSILYFILTFLIGGFDEMNDALILAISFLLLVSIFLGMKKGAKRNTSLWLTASILIASVASMLLMAIAPHNSARITHPPTFLLFLERILTYPQNFIVDSTFTPFPLPTLLSFLVPFLIFLLFYKQAQKTKKHLWIALFIIPLIFYALLIINFSPSAYAQAYPADRALLGARFLMTATLFFESALLVYLLPPIKSTYLTYFFLLTLAFFSLYPLRAALQTLNTVDFYRQRAIAWDLRDDKIDKAAANGEKEIHIQEFDSLHAIKELDSNPNHWVNRCAARYYGVDSISADLNYGK